MARRHFWIGSAGPYYYDDAAAPVADPAAVLPVGQMQAAVVSEGHIVSLAAPVANNQVLRYQDQSIILDGTLGRVLRSSVLYLEDGTDPSTVKATLGSVWNGQVVAATDNIGKTDTWVGNFKLSVDGSMITVNTPTNTVAVLALWIRRNETTVSTAPNADALLTNLICQFRNATTGNLLDLTSMVDIGDISLKFTYLTED